MEMIYRFNILLLNGNGYIPPCSRLSMKDQKIAIFLVFIFLASITHLDYFSENEKLELEMNDEIIVQGSSSNPNHDVGNFSRGGYHIATGDWHEAINYATSINDSDGDGIENSNDSAPQNPFIPSSKPQRASNCNVRLSNCLQENIPIFNETNPFGNFGKIKFGDLDGNGFMDMVGISGNSLKFHLNTDSTFNSSPDFEYSTSSQFSDLELIDIDNDGDLDIIIGAKNFKNILFKNRGGTFSNNPDWESNQTSNTIKISLGDLNGDGYLDLAVGNLNSATEIYLNDQVTFEKSPSVNLVDSGLVTWADFDSDGDEDLLIGKKLFSNDNGVLQVSPIWSTTGSCGAAAAWGDINNDGTIDLFCGNSIYLNTVNGLETQPSWTVPGNDNIADVKFADLNNDGNLDIILGRDLDPNMIIMNNGSGFNNSPFKHIGSEDYMTTSAFLADINNDGDLEFGFTNLYNIPEFYVKHITSLFQPSERIISVAYDYDYSVNPIAAAQLWNNQFQIAIGHYDVKIYSGDFSYLLSEIKSIYATDLTFGDIDGDNDLDLAIARSGRNYVYENTGSTFENSSYYWQSDNTLNSKSIVWGDINQDGHTDMVVGNYGVNELYLSNGNTLGISPVWTSNTSKNTNELKLGDIDNDGKLDLIVGNNGLNEIYFGSENYFENTPSWTSLTNENTASVELLDVDNNGFLDVATGNLNGKNEIFFNYGGIVESIPKWNSTNTFDTYAVTAGDIDGDGDFDLAYGNYFEINEIFINNGTSLKIDSLHVDSAKQYTTDLLFVDYNKDGASDLVEAVVELQGMPPQLNKIWLSKPDSDRDTYPNDIDSFQWDPTQYEDFDNDGYGDSITGYQFDSCPGIWGSSWRDRGGCPDEDGDGQSNLNDDFWTKNTQWLDSDGDGLGDNWANGAFNDTRSNHWPGQWVENAYNPDPYPFDFDNDGFEDESIEGTQGPFDACPFSYGTSSTDRSGCQDSDGDGRSDRTADWTNEDGADMFPTDITQWIDSDGDGFGDNPFPANNPDACPSEYGTSLKDGYGCLDLDDDGWGLTDDCPNSAGNSTIDQIGCPDRDGDGYSDDGDSSPDEPDIWSNIDGDAYFDQGTEETRDNCPSEAGTSYRDRLGCVDPDGDGWSSQGGNMLAHPLGDADSHPTDATQWRDRDGDGYGDNQTGNSPDACPDLNGPSKWTVVDGQKVPHFGCEDSDLDGFTDEIDTCPNVAGASEGVNWGCPDSDNDGTQDSEDSCPSLSGTSTANLKACPDSDNDGIADLEDPQPLVALIGISTPEDWDGDGVNNNDDEYPFEQTQWEDLDGDGFGDNSSGVNGDPSPSDYDNDFWLDPSDLSTTVLGCLNNPEEGMDYFPEDSREWKDNDGDCIGDNSDPDDDNDGYSDVEEAQQGTDPLSSSSKPIEGFEIIVPGTEISLGAWDLIGIFGGVPFFAWIGFGIVTRNSRTARFEDDLKAANSREELEEIAKRWEFALMIKLIGPHQGIRLERMRAEYDDRFENQAFDDGPITTEDQTMLVENSAKEIPEIEKLQLSTVAPSKETPATSVGTDGYEWYKSESGADYFRTTGSNEEWIIFD